MEGLGRSWGLTPSSMQAIGGFELHNNIAWPTFSQDRFGCRVENRMSGLEIRSGVVSEEAVAAVQAGGDDDIGQELWSQAVVE